MELLGGTIWIESQYGKGTSAFFRIPLKEVFVVENAFNQLENSLLSMSCNCERSWEIINNIQYKNTVRYCDPIIASRKILTTKFKLRNDF